MKSTKKSAKKNPKKTISKKPADFSTFENAFYDSLDALTHYAITEENRLIKTQDSLAIQLAKAKAKAKASKKPKSKMTKSLENQLVKSLGAIEDLNAEIAHTQEALTLATQRADKVLELAEVIEQFFAQAEKATKKPKTAKKPASKKTSPAIKSVKPAKLTKPIKQTKKPEAPVEEVEEFDIAAFFNHDADDFGFFSEEANTPAPELTSEPALKTETEIKSESESESELISE